MNKMSQADILNYLQANKGKWFNYFELRKHFNNSTCIAGGLKKLRKWKLVNYKPYEYPDRYNVTRSSIQYKYKTLPK